MAQRKVRKACCTQICNCTRSSAVKVWHVHQSALQTQLSHCIHTVNSQLIIQQFYMWQMSKCNIPHIIQSKCEVITNLTVTHLFQWSIITFHCHNPCMLTDIFSPSSSHIPKSRQSKHSCSRKVRNVRVQFNVWHSCHDRMNVATCSGILLNNNEHQLEYWAKFNTAMANYFIFDPENLTYWTNDHTGLVGWLFGR